MSITITIIIVFVMFIITIYNLNGSDQTTSKNENKEFVNYVPTLLTTLGIFGTFLGVTLGLWNFDENNIQNSVTLLLGGLKTAFITSVFGILFSICFKWHLTKRNKNLELKNQKITPKDMMDIFKLQLANMENQNQELQSIKKGLVTEYGQSLITKLINVENENSSLLLKQLDSFHDDLGINNRTMIEKIEFLTNKLERGFESLIKKQSKISDEIRDCMAENFTNFTESLSKTTTEQIIEALQNVVANFNENLTEQFGENFKRLDDGVKELVVWQKNYKQQLEEMTDLYAKGVEAISSTEESLENISESMTNIEESTEKIPENMEKLALVIDKNQEQLEELEVKIETFAIMRDKAVEAIPLIQERVDTAIDGIKKVSEILTESAENISKNFKNSMESQTDQANSVLESIKDKIAETMDGVEKNIKTLASEVLDGITNDVLESIKDEVSNTIEDIGENVKNQVGEAVTGILKISETLTESAENISENFENSMIRQTELAENTLKSMENKTQNTVDSIEKMVDGITKSTAYINKGLEKTIDASMDEMGSSLAAITTRFSEDYTKLTNSMKQVVDENKKVAR